MDSIRVLIAEDAPDVRSALAELVNSDEAMTVVGTAADADEAIILALQTKPDVALVDVKMPGGGGARAAREIRHGSPRTHVVAISAYEDRRTVLEMLRAGVVGYVVKGTPAEEILVTIRRSMQGQGSLSVEVTADVIKGLAQLLEGSESMTRELRQLDRTKRELIEVLSHELFTPITAIQGFALIVADRGEHMSRDEIRSLADGVSRASGRIKRLVGNLSALARLDRESVDIPTRPTPAEAVVERAVDEFPLLRDRLAITGVETTHVRLWADLELAGRALVIVLENAFAFSDADAPVELSVHPRSGSVLICVTDQGPGIPLDTQERIFEAFTQADGSSTRQHQGLGVGLFLAQRIMRAHGGGIEVESSPGHGSTFRLAFPAFAEGTSLPS